MPWILLILALFSCLTAPAEEVTLEASLDRERIYLGESAILTLKLQGASVLAVPPDFSKVPGIAVEDLGGSPQNQSFVSIVNGQVTRNEFHGLLTRWKLTPRQGGILTLPPLPLEAGGTRLTLPTLTLQVEQPEANPHLSITISCDPPEPSVEEPCTLTVTVFIKRLTAAGKPVEFDPYFDREPPHLSIPWIDKLEHFTPEDPEFLQHLVSSRGFSLNEYVRDTGFFGFEQQFALFQFDRGPATLSNDTPAYAYRLHRRFIPTRSGSFTLSPVSVKAHLPTAIDAQGEVEEHDRFFVSSSPLVLNVLPVPEAGRPDNFSGAIGDFSVETEARPAEARVGDPVTLTLRIKPLRPTRSVFPPPIEKDPGLARDFRVHPPSSNPTQARGTYTYTASLRPLRTDVKEIPAIPFCFYDPRQKSFRTVSSRPLPLRVLPGEALDERAIQETALPRETSELVRSAEGLLANHEGPELWTPQGSVSPHFWSLSLAAGFLPLLYLALFFYLRYREKYLLNPEAARRRRARPEALGRLAHADGEDPAAVIYDYLADKYGRSRGSLTPAEALSLLPPATPEEIRGELASLGERAASARYGGPGSRPGTEDTQAARTLLARLEKVLK